MAFYQIIEVINPDCLFELKPEEIFGDTSYYVLNRLIRANQLKCAQQFFDHLESQTVNENIYIDMFKDDENIIELFLAKNDFGKAAELLELLIAKQYSSNGYASSDIKLPRSTNYDAFTQSKEYKAMMARVYTAPDKR